jgi:hypothetical protein
MASNMSLLGIDLIRGWCWRLMTKKKKLEL